MIVFCSFAPSGDAPSYKAPHAPVTYILRPTAFAQIFWSGGSSVSSPVSAYTSATPAYR